MTIEKIALLFIFSAYKLENKWENVSMLRDLKVGLLLLELMILFQRV